MNGNYDILYNQFHWDVSGELNIAAVCCGRWAETNPSGIAIYYEDDTGNTSKLTYSDLQAKSNQFSNLLYRLGIKRNDCIAIMLPQRMETAIAHIGCYQAGAIAMPMSVLYGPEAIEYRLQNSEATVAIADQSCLSNINEIRSQCPSLRHLIIVDCISSGSLNWDEELSKESPVFQSVKTFSGDPAILIYTSGTTGPPKGALIPHSAIIGTIPGFVASQNGYPKEGDMFWSPADWAWTGGLMDALLPALYFGQAILSYKGRFSAETAFYLLQKYKVTNTFLFPTALRMMKKFFEHSHQKYELRLRAIMTAGEAVSEEIFNWGESAFGLTLNEMFGQTEINYIVGNSAEQWPAKPGSMGRPYPGHRVAVIDDDGNIVKTGETGEIAVNRKDIHGVPDPVMFIAYWKNPEATKKKFTGDWCRTGDLACMDEDGYLWYKGRADDVFKSSGYRIGPFEIENCLLQHPAIFNVAVVPKPDAERGSIVKAFIILNAGVERSKALDDLLIAELQNLVRGKLAPYEYPKEIEFVDELPMTTTGKLQRSVLRDRENKKADDSKAFG